jgi:hypothetical protein
MSNPSDLLTNLVHFTYRLPRPPLKPAKQDFVGGLHKIYTLLRIFTPGANEVKHVDSTDFRGAQLSTTALDVGASGTIRRPQLSH